MDLCVGLLAATKRQKKKIYKTKDWAHRQSETTHKSKQTSEAGTSRTMEAEFAYQQAQRL